MLMKGLHAFINMSAMKFVSKKPSNKNHNTQQTVLKLAWHSLHEHVFWHGGWASSQSMAHQSTKWEWREAHIGLPKAQSVYFKVCMQRVLSMA